MRAAIELLADHGYAVSARCIDCGHVIATDSSLARMRGPHCHAKAKAVTA
ncbi:Uncharacterised protein [Mycolicibacterium gilvum]|uniref:Uncharacterized protein n=1 Tax=Mycolicibacterium gilvum TaxID=1804 RepID=A0A378SMQ4_9MYCO|nr:Uncharacterised protein [Mycolicibacterium gilvum]